WRAGLERCASSRSGKQPCLPAGGAGRQGCLPLRTDANPARRRRERDEARSMSRFTRTIRNLFRNPSPTRPGPRPARRRLEVERLEDRCVPAGNATGDITGTAFVDANGNGLRDAQESSFPGAVLTLTGTTDQGTPVNAGATADDQGSFDFRNVPP